MEENTPASSDTPCTNPPPPPPVEPPAAPPPPLSPPPVIAPPGPPTRPRRRYGWMVFAIILLLLLGISVLMNLSHFVGGFTPMSVSRARPAGPRLEEVVTEDNDAANAKIAVVGIDGIITSRAIDQSGYNMVDVI